MNKNPLTMLVTRGTIFVFVFTVLFSVPSFSQRRERLIDTWKPTHFDIDLTFDAKLTSIQAKASVDVVVVKDNTSVIDLDFGTMPVTAVTVGSSSARFTQHDQKLDVYLAAPAARSQALRITVTYAGKPSGGLVLTKDKDGSPSAI